MDVDLVEEWLDGSRVADCWIVMSTALVPCTTATCPSGCRANRVRFGSFTRKSDSSKQQRYRCSHCRRTFSDATSDLCYRQKKRELNPRIFIHYCSSVSIRRLGLLLHTTRKTVVRKIQFLALHADRMLEWMNSLHDPVKEMQFDDLETFEHTKCKPLSVTLAVDHPSRRILGFRVAQMAASGPLAKISRAKYGRRVDGRRESRRSLLRELRHLVDASATIHTDMNPYYVDDVREFFPKARHEKSKGRRALEVGQGELKGGGYDPLFSINHTLAMIRANVNRLVRRTWCTTKRRDRLVSHLTLYALYHNLVLLGRGKSSRN